MHTYRHGHTHARTCVCVCARAHTHRHGHTHTRAHARTHTHTHRHGHTHARARTHAHTGLYVQPFSRCYMFRSGRYWVRLKLYRWIPCTYRLCDSVILAQRLFLFSQGFNHSLHPQSFIRSVSHSLGHSVITWSITQTYSVTGSLCFYLLHNKVIVLFVPRLGHHDDDNGCSFLSWSHWWEERA